MTYEISFNAFGANGEYVGTLHLPVLSSRLSNFKLGNENQQILEKMCVDYARTSGLNCSSVTILEVEQKGEA